MADQIKHGSQQIVAANSSIDVSALPASGVSAGDYNNSKTNIVGLAIDAAGRITGATNTANTISGVTIAAANSTANTEAFSHVLTQNVYVSTSAPADNTIGSNGDIWYQTIT